jgi:diaminohydroxyphosphoribosylaminopyrimidine deaminase/5-amino-6-(5-phosphoribosylamino)uracil reductase
MIPDDDLKFMRRCLDLALKAEGMTYPNPMVGSVIVNNGRIIGEGYHLRPGGPHAEVVAIDSVRDQALLKTSTLYVNLEPCSHFGKTPPCADLIISKGIPVVIAGTKDTSGNVSGKGFARLREAGCRVIEGIAEDECRRINRRFFSFHEKKRPYITLKWAQSRDGFIDTVRDPAGEPGPVWISGESERVLVHKWRASEQAILVGAETVRLDDPKLNVREWQGNNPVRLVLSGSGILPEKLSMCGAIGSQVVFTFYPEKVAMPGTVVVKLNNHEPSAVQISDYLYRWGIQSLFIEGGAKVLNHFIKTGLWDEARIFYGGQIFGDGVTAPEPGGKLVFIEEFRTSNLKVFLNEDLKS